MHDGRHRPYRIPLMGGGDMVSADLHADHYFVRLAKYHGTQSGHGFSQCQAGTSVQDAERLAGTFVHGDSGLYPIFGGISVLYAQISHQCMAGTLVELLQRHVGGADFGKYRLLHGFGHAVFIVGGSDAVGTDLHRVLGVSHGDAQSGGLYHGDIANSVANGDDFFGVDA